MASLLEGRIAKAVARGFKGKLRKGQIRRVATAGVDDFGDALPAGVQTFPFEGIREDYSASFRAQAGIPEEDFKVLVIAGLAGVQPSVGDQVFIQKRWGEVRKLVDSDPAEATFTLQCFEIADPT